MISNKFRKLSNLNENRYLNLLNFEIVRQKLEIKNNSLKMTDFKFTNDTIWTIQIVVK